MGSYSCCGCSPCFNALITTGIVLMSVGLGLCASICFLPIGVWVFAAGVVCLIVGLILMCVAPAEEDEKEKMPIYGAVQAPMHQPQMHMQQPQMQQPVRAPQMQQSMA